MSLCDRCEYCASKNLWLDAFTCRKKGLVEGKTLYTEFKRRKKGKKR